MGDDFMPHYILNCREDVLCAERGATILQTYTWLGNGTT